MIDWNKPIEFKSVTRGWIPAELISNRLKHPTLPIAISYASVEGHEMVMQMGQDGKYLGTQKVRNVPETKTVFQTALEKKKTTSITTAYKPELRVGDDGKSIGHPGWKVMAINQLTIQAAA